MAERDTRIELTESELCWPKIPRAPGVPDFGDAYPTIREETKRRDAPSPPPSQTPTQKLRKRPGPEHERIAPTSRISPT